jgi:pyruvate dehydrogenase E2 component (dihydrolipoamide acetyltransferase)
MKKKLWMPSREFASVDNLHSVGRGGTNLKELQANRIFATPRARKMAKFLEIPLDRVEGTGPNGRIIEEDVRLYQAFNGDAATSYPTQLKGPEEKKVKATPLAKKVAKVRKIDLSMVEGTGFEGKIVGLDVLNFTPSMEQLRTPLSGMRKIIAERMVFSKQTSPHVTITVKTEMTKMEQYRSQLLETGSKVSYTDILVKVVALALQNHPRINVSLDKGEIVHHQDFHIGVAVAVEDGLVVPVIHNANQRSLSDISKTLKEKVKRVKQGKMVPDDFNNGRFTISNLGMYEVDAFTPIINQPESAILGVGRIIEDLIVNNGQIRIGKTMVLSLSFDHRVIDGAPAALFLKNIKDLLEQPESLQNT